MLWNIFKKCFHRLNISVFVSSCDIVWVTAQAWPMCRYTICNSKYVNMSFQIICYFIFTVDSYLRPYFFLKAWAWPSHYSFQTWSGLTFIPEGLGFCFLCQARNDFNLFNLHGPKYSVPILIHLIWKSFSQHDQVYSKINKIYLA